MLEIEKKFIINAQTLSFLEENAESLGVKEIEDIYFDDDKATLIKQDFWLRKRNGIYELKFPHPQNSIQTNFYHEIQGRDSVEEKIKLSVDLLIPYCHLHSKRQKFSFNSCTIDVDEVTSPNGFHYLIAEVEKLVENDSQIKDANQAIADTAKILKINTFVCNGKVFQYLQQYRPELFKIAEKLHC